MNGSEVATGVAKFTLTYRLAAVSRSEGWLRWSGSHPILAWLLVRLPLLIIAVVILPFTFASLVFLAIVDTAIERGWKRALIGDSKASFADYIAQHQGFR